MVEGIDGGWEKGYIEPSQFNLSKIQINIIALK